MAKKRTAKAKFRGSSVKVTTKRPGPGKTVGTRSKNVVPGMSIPTGLKRQRGAKPSSVKEIGAFKRAARDHRGSGTFGTTDAGVARAALRAVRAALGPAKKRAAKRKK